MSGIKFITLILFTLTGLCCCNVQKKEEVITAEYASIPARLITINNPHGKIKVEGWNQDKIGIKAVKKASENQLCTIAINRIMSDTKAVIKTCLLPSTSFSFFNWFKPRTAMNIEVDYCIKVPMKSPVMVKSKIGDITVKNISSQVIIKAGKSTIRAENLGGNLTICAKQADIAATTIKGSVAIETIKGDIGLINIGSSARVTLNCGDIMTQGITGPLSIQGKKTDVIGKQVHDAVSITLEQGTVGLKNLRGPVEVFTKMGDIELENVQSNAVAQTGKGTVRFINNPRKNA